MYDKHNSIATKVAFVDYSACYNCLMNLSLKRASVCGLQYLKNDMVYFFQHLGKFVSS